MFSFHLAEVRSSTATKAMVQPPDGRSAPGLHHAECMAMMELGASVVSPSRFQIGRMAMFAAWDDETAIESFLTDDPFGRELAAGWHVRMRFIRRWGTIEEFDGLPRQVGDDDPNAPVVAVTLARLKLPQLTRFSRWGKPVEELVRDHPGQTLALAAVRPPRTFSTFSVWRSARQMTDMVHGRGDASGHERHAVAMEERRRKDFHSEFTTLPFTATGEYGQWRGKSDFVPGL